MSPSCGYSLEVYDDGVIFRVLLSRRVERALVALPPHVVSKLKAWVDMVADEGLENARKVPGFHDEPLKGERKGQRSIALAEPTARFTKSKKIARK